MKKEWINGNLKKKTVHIKRKSPKLRSSKTIYSFDSFDSFCDFCTFISQNVNQEEIKDFVTTSNLYEYNSSYYLILTNINLESPKIHFFCSTITEFAHFVEHSELFEKKIQEYRKSNYRKKCDRYLYKIFCLNDN